MFVEILFLAVQDQFQFDHKILFLYLLQYFLTKYRHFHDIVWQLKVFSLYVLHGGINLLVWKALTIGSTSPEHFWQWEKRISWNMHSSFIKQYEQICFQCSAFSSVLLISSSLRSWSNSLKKIIITIRPFDHVVFGIDSLSSNYINASKMGAIFSDVLFTFYSFFRC